MFVREGNKTVDDFAIIVEMAKYHPFPEYDCKFQDFVSYFKYIYMNPFCKAWIAFEEEKAIGYFVALRVKDLKNEIVVFDIFFIPSERGKHIILEFVKKVRDWAREEKALRVVWTSKFPVDKWIRILLPAKDREDMKETLSEYKTIVWEVE